MELEKANNRSGRCQSGFYSAEGTNGLELPFFDMFLDYVLRILSHSRLLRCESCRICRPGAVLP